jgi:tRNA (Thr-GGU) A37 N-methylase
VLTLHPALPRDLLAGLDEFTHVWIIYAFHANTNANSTTPRHAPPVVKAKVRVPRLDGAVRGALATRTPHRPVPVGLSLARVVAVDVRLGAVTLAGADLVDGTPVLDVKPYVPFCDRVEDAEAPSWVGRGGATGRQEECGEEDPLAMRRVSIPDDVAERVGDAYERGARAKRAKRVGHEPAPAKAAEAETAEAVAAEAVAAEASTSSSGGQSKEGRGAGRGGSAGGGGEREKKFASKETIAEEGSDRMKALKKALKDRRRSGLEPPDALYPSGAAFVALVREVLALDVRSTRERVADADAKRFETYRVTLCDVEVEYEVDEREREVRVLGAREVEPLERPGETRRDAKQTNE